MLGLPKLYILKTLLNVITIFDVFVDMTKWESPNGVLKQLPPIILRCGED